MKFHKILPAAAGMIALTASIAFAGDYRSREESKGLRMRISESESGGEAAGNAFVPLAIDSESGHVYRVEISYGEKSETVLVDAHSGRVMRGAAEQAA